MATVSSIGTIQDKTTKLDFKSDFRYVLGLSFIFLVATLAFFIGVKGFNHFFNHAPYLVLIPSIAVTILGFKFKRHDFTRALQPVFYLAVFIPIIYISFAYLSYTPQNESDIEILRNLKIAHIISVICAILSLYRPFLAMITFTYLPWYHLMAGKLLIAIPNDLIDWVVLVEMGIFILLCTLSLSIAEKYISKEKLYGKERGDSKNPVTAKESIFIVAIGMHLANYFYSFVQKLILDGGPTTWVLENPTYEFIAYAIDRGLFPMAGLPHEMSFTLHQLLETFVLPANIMVFAAQALAIFAFSHRKLLIGITLFYDVMHIVIFIVTGIFFWKWILLNLTIVFAMSYWKHTKISTSLNLAAIGFITISVAFFSIARLGWYDLHAGRVTHIIAHYKDGQKFEVPTNYFLSYSFRMIFTFDHVTPSGFHDHISGFGTFSKDAYQRLQESKSCDLKLTGTAIDPDHPRLGVNVAKRLIQSHHKYILNNVDENGYINYDLYPHHVWSDPFAFEEFKQTDKRDIIGYEIVNSSVCSRFDEDGKYNPILKYKDSVYVSVK